ncbi:unnamed protein product [Schistosoma curassoni]|uniref:Anticodon_1 domain-containing protein n=1 Tax=Schistosoma curassoni TaxID=6186 RepID=A0A183KQU9_9TREM|nr:unnamed protein product [Schistosoma curassoni]
MLTPIAPIYASELWSGVQLACLTSKHSNLYEVLSVYSNRTVMRTNENKNYHYSHWPYDLTKYVLEQPFPKCLYSTEIPELIVEQYETSNTTTTSTPLPK